MSGFGAMDQMVKSYRSNRELLRGGEEITQKNLSGE
jgi:hypothetical protein